jgi:hypothetical protein
MSRWHPHAGDTFIYDGTLYELCGGNNIYWIGRAIEHDELSIRITHKNWAEAQKNFSFYKSVIYTNPLDEDLFTI